MLSSLPVSGTYRRDEKVLVRRKTHTGSGTKPWAGIVAAGPYVGNMHSGRGPEHSGADDERVCRRWAITVSNNSCFVMRTDHFYTMKSSPI